MGSSTCLAPGTSGMYRFGASVSSARRQEVIQAPACTRKIVSGCWADSDGLFALIEHLPTGAFDRRGIGETELKVDALYVGQARFSIQDGDHAAAAANAWLVVRQPAGAALLADPCSISPPARVGRRASAPGRRRPRAAVPAPCPRVHRRRSGRALPGGARRRCGTVEGTGQYREKELHTW
jgi:hypothetical protein